MDIQGSNIRIIIADSEAIFRAGMSKIFTQEPDLEVVAQTDSLAQTLATVSETEARRLAV